MRPSVSFLSMVIAAGAVGPAASQAIVAANGDLQRALNAAFPGDTIFLEPGATYVGHFVLPARSSRDTRPTLIRTAGPDAVPEGQRMTPDSAGRLAKLRSPDAEPVLRTAPGARGWTIELVEFAPSANGAGDMIQLGDGSAQQKLLATVPSDLTLDRVYVHGDPEGPQKRAVALNSARTTISNSYFADIKAAGQDSQAIGGWNGPGDYTIENNYLEAAGENVIFGGADPSIIGLTPTHIIFRRNQVSKPLAWRQPGAQWTVKNLLELKNARDVLIEENVFERNWEAGQAGFAILFTVRNQDGGCGWCQVENVRFRSNIVRDVAAGLAILGIDPNAPSRQTNGVVIRGNLFDGIDRSKWGGNGYFLQLTDKPRDIVVDHNTIVLGDSSGLANLDGQIDGFVFTNNLAMHGEYGIHASDHGTGNDSINAALPGAKFTANVLAGSNTRAYPPGNLFPTLQEFQSQFSNFANHDFRLKPASAWTRAATDGGSLGAMLSSDGVPLVIPEGPSRR
jgi:hypothetical protein